MHKAIKYLVKLAKRLFQVKEVKPVVVRSVNESVTKVVAQLYSESEQTETAKVCREADKCSVFKSLSSHSTSPAVTELINTAMDIMASNPIPPVIVHELEDASNMLDALLKSVDADSGLLMNCKDFLRKSTMKSLLNSVVKIEDHLIEGDASKQGVFLGSYINMLMRNLQVSIIPDQLRDALLLSDISIEGKAELLGIVLTFDQQRYMVFDGIGVLLREMASFSAVDVNQLAKVVSLATADNFVIRANQDGNIGERGAAMDILKQAMYISTQAERWSEVLGGILKIWVSES